LWLIDKRAINLQRLNNQFQEEITNLASKTSSVRPQNFWTDQAQQCREEIKSNLRGRVKQPIVKKIKETHQNLEGEEDKHCKIHLRKFVWMSVMNSEAKH
jgi:hypothetical protein